VSGCGALYGGHGQGCDGCPPINVREMGARGNGTHDDAPAIQASIDRAMAEGRDVCVPAGEYRLESGLSWVPSLGPTSSIVAAPRIRGAGRFESVLLSYTSDPILHLDFGSGTTGPALYHRGEGGVLSGLGLVGMDGSSIGLRIRSLWSSVIDDCLISDFAGDGVEIYGNAAILPDYVCSNQVQIRNSRISGNGDWGINSTQNVCSNYLLVDQSSLEQNSSGGLRHMSHYVVAHETRIAGNGGTGIYVVYPGVGIAPQGWMIDGCEFDEQPTAHIRVDSTIAGTIARCRFVVDPIAGSIYPANCVVLDNGGTGTGTGTRVVDRIAIKHNTISCEQDITAIGTFGGIVCNPAVAAMGGIVDYRGCQLDIDGNDHRLVNAANVHGTHWFSIMNTLETFFLPNNSAVVRYPHPYSGMVYVANLGLATQTAEALVRCHSGPTCSGYNGVAPANVSFLTGILTGTTGPVGNLSISAEASRRLYIENRTGATATISLRIMR